MIKRMLSDRISLGGEFRDSALEAEYRTKRFPENLQRLRRLGLAWTVPVIAASAILVDPHTDTELFITFALPTLFYLALPLSFATTLAASRELSGQRELLRGNLMIENDLNGADLAQLAERLQADGHVPELGARAGYRGAGGRRGIRPAAAGNQPHRRLRPHRKAALGGGAAAPGSAESGQDHQRRSGGSAAR
jgi:hypothetical protein